MKICDAFNEIIDELYCIANNSPEYNRNNNVSRLKTSEKMTLALWKFVDQTLKTSSVIFTIGDINELVRFFEQYLVKKYRIPFFSVKRTQNHQMISMRRDYYGKLFYENNYCFEDVLSFLSLQLTTIETYGYYGLNNVSHRSTPYRYEKDIREEASDFIEKLGSIFSDEKLKKPEPAPILVITQEEYEKQFDKDREIEDGFDVWEGTKYDAATNYEPIPPGQDQNPNEGYVLDWYKWEVITPKYKRARVNNHIIEYWEERHKYRVDKVWVPSVSQILEEYYPLKSTDSQYAVKTTSEAIKATKLMKKAIFDYESEGVECDLPQLAKYIKMRNEYNYMPISNRLFVACFNGAIPLYAGTIDILLQNMDKTYSLLCLKGTSNLKVSRVTLQQNLYRIALEQCSNQCVSKIICFQITKDSYGWPCTIEKEEYKTATVLKKRYEDYCKKYKEWEIAKKNPGPEYRIKDFKPGDTVLYDGRKGIIKCVDCKNDIVEVYILRFKVIVKTTLEDAQMKEMRIVSF